MAGGFLTTNTSHLIRANLWSGDLKQQLEDELMGTRYIRMISGFPDGDTFNIPSIGQAEVLDYIEGNPIEYTAMDTGNYTFTVTEYKQSATYITNKMRQQSFYAAELEAMFVPKQHRAIMASLENDIMSIGPDNQTASNANLINGANHRWVASGTSETMDVIDFAKARYALQQANVPMTDLVAIVDPSVEYKMNTLTNLVNVSNNPRWEGIIDTSINSTGMKFIVNIYGFDVYVSQRLKSGMVETIGAKSVTTGVANLFFSASPDVLPFVGLIRQSPRVDSEYNKDFQREEYVTTARWGTDLFRPEALVVVLSDTDQVTF